MPKLTIETIDQGVDKFSLAQVVFISLTISSFKTEVPIIYKPVHWFVEQYPLKS